MISLTPLRESLSSLRPQAAQAAAEVPEWLSISVRFIFSWVILMPIAVIAGGKLLGQLFKLDGQDDDSFRIRVPPVLKFSAKKEEVLLGVALFIIDLFLVGAFFGEDTYLLFKREFGVDPGQFNSICTFSSFLSVLVSTTILLVSKGFGQLRRIRPDPVIKEHEELIEQLRKDDPQKNAGSRND
ncbi:hypothetical protein [Winogradskya humida]|uniref:hypothetical protein n=1 Tax=Winogradskya humida TaxID=113566 RepID=UPI0031D16B3E